VSEDVSASLYDLNSFDLLFERWSHVRLELSRGMGSQNSVLYAHFFLSVS
jgi:hypothetical protein